MSNDSNAQSIGHLQLLVLGAVVSFTGSYGLVWTVGFRDGVVAGLFILYTVVMFSAAEGHFDE